MNQLAMEFTPRNPMPTVGSQAHTLLLAFRRGERLTTMEAFSRYRITTISQRCGELRRLGWPIKDETVDGKTYKRYWMDAQ